MNAKTRVLCAIASVLSTGLMMGSVLTLADHYGDVARVATVKAHMVAQR